MKITYDETAITHPGVVNVVTLRASLESVVPVAIGNCSFDTDPAFRDVGSQIEVIYSGELTQPEIDAAEAVVMGHDGNTPGPSVAEKVRTFTQVCFPSVPTPMALTEDVSAKIQNDDGGLGSTSFPESINFWDAANHQLDFSTLDLGDQVRLIAIGYIQTSLNDTTASIIVKTRVGTANESEFRVDLPTYSDGAKVYSIVTDEIVLTVLDDEFRDSPAQVEIETPHAGVSFTTALFNITAITQAS